ncbi:MULTISPECIES: bifunctional GTP diphosphokinase/guanosine-3',5'-bis pyrophosphate 3'-pyrophosphohydrolase [Corallincola]|uniref:guanosine-3',5'-bis(diphosphate) 3'-diphosphatase n=3 Tax=Corallincola TaxID=1775176 RepID=A0A368NNX8_9GAMM|nr:MULTISPECIES: bifunctional GTP diphosphokinase/guanosine-3',5'-bis pyrophosphate 3'-pyrophosphohydrolase [Corallincola]RCU51011.1 guanosine-3',5'-bis(diphosphate) 3'-diphosphatase [Corallincola holothuriorum]TAA45963.1 bifunctional GTP diphosphokinase/guanosine-3',5'-bis pyrophosphate 3'-pyrophosphohydrolase [Corallincola spongiicola]TCI04071.1 bifunctional GTP diphosphokinase/guanosine-3',5'-bis pyrophosphate 3'-pyrophosphohydrolase [Corallincola luteus]
MYLFEGLKEQISGYLEPAQVSQVQQAYIVSRDAHQGQMRTSGDPYITHPVAVARFLADMRLDHETLMAALLHDVIEDTELNREDLAELFGSTVADLVEGVSKLDKIQFDSKEEAQAENFRKMIMAMVVDIRVILIKLADRTHNMRTIFVLRPDKRRRIARETLEVYAPLANRLGIHNIKNELEDLGFHAMYPARYRVIKEAVRKAAGNRKELMRSIKEEIEGRLQDADVPGKAVGREKHLYSIYRKMVSKELQLHEVMDIYAFRVIVHSIDDCYRVLGVMHRLYKPRPGRFKDYIAIPKANGYQSLHTSLVGPHGVPVEIQIRTDDMDQMADKGVAAHWVYKQDGDRSGTTAQVRARQWMQSLLELQQSAGSSFEFIENVKTDLFPEEIYVFTPDGRIIELPDGATPVDFAYAVHSDVGNTCVGARVDRKAFPLSQKLKSGQTVEIITSPGARPNAAWLNFVITSKARAKIRQLLKRLRSEESTALGRRLINHALGAKRLEDIPEAQIERALEALRQPSLEDLLSEVGLGNAMSAVVARRLLGELDDASGTDRNHFPIRGVEGLLLSYAKCCHPIPGDPIIAHVSPGKGLVIHHESCKNIRGYDKEPERYFAVDWDEARLDEEQFLAALRIDIVNHQGALAKLTALIANTDANIHSLSTEEKDGRIYLIHLVLTIRDRVHLAGVMRRIRVMPDVLKISRNRN